MTTTSSVEEIRPPLLESVCPEICAISIIFPESKSKENKILTKRKSNPPSRSVSPSNQDAGMLFRVSKRSGIESISVGEISSGSSSRNDSPIDSLILSSSSTIEIPSSARDYGFALASKAAAVEGEKVWSTTISGTVNSSITTFLSSEQEFSFDADREDGGNGGIPLEYVRKTTSSSSSNTNTFTIGTSNHLLILEKKPKRKYKRREEGLDEVLENENFIIRRGGRRSRSVRRNKNEYFDDEDDGAEDEDDGAEGAVDGDLDSIDDKIEEVKKKRGAKGSIDRNNRVCISCQTTKTPYWRESWSSKVSLCNACGLRWGKFRHRCSQCCYVPRKEDKGTRSCSRCGGSWA